MKVANNILHLNKTQFIQFINIVRILTGIVIFAEGIAFVNNSVMLFHIVEKSRIGGFALILEHHVAFSLLAGGILIALGLITRIAVLFQLPIFFGVLLNPHAQYGLYAVYGNQTFSIVILFFLIVLLIWGPGKFSADYRLRQGKLK